MTSDPPVIIAFVAVLALLAMLLVMALVVRRGLQSVAPGEALLVIRAGGQPTRVVLEGGVLVLPIVHRAERLDISLKTLELERRGRDGLICRDGVRADVRARFFVRVQPTTEAVLAVAQSLGAARAGDQETLEQLFGAKFAEAMKSAAAQLEFEQLVARRDEFRDQVVALVGKDLNGFVLEDLALDALEQTPLEALDPNNILDAKGIEKVLAARGRADQAMRRARQERGERDDDDAPVPIFEQATERLEPGLLLPAPAWPGADTTTLVLAGGGGSLVLAGSASRVPGASRPRLELREAAAPDTSVLALALDAPLDCQLSRGEATLHVALRQRCSGRRAELELSAPLGAYLDALGADAATRALAERLPRLGTRALELSGADLASVLAAVHHGQQLQGAASTRWLR